MVSEASFTESPLLDQAPDLDPSAGSVLTMENPFSVSSAQLWDIVERSAFLEERLSGDFLPHAHAEDSPAARQRMSAWRNNCARGNEKIFANRLRWDGLDEDRARLLAGRVRWAKPEGELPSWARLLPQMMEFSRQPWNPWRRERDLASIRGDQPVAFEEFHYPYLLLARETLRQESGSAYSLLADTAHRQWERPLLLSLDAVAAATLDFEFRGFRQRQSIPPADQSEPESARGDGSRQLYERFLDSLRGEGLLRLFQEYPVLARYLATRLSQWVDAAREFLLHLEADRAKLESRFNHGQSLGQVTRLDPALSDRHRGGRTALRAHFSAGIRLIYKPKNIGAEGAYWDLLGWINQHAGLPSLHTLKVLDGGAYGWVEEVEPRPCRDQREVEAFYYRSGMLLCLVFALEGTDCHNENLIAAGEHPVLIDHETLLQPRIRYFGPRGEEGPLSLANRFFYQDSVFRTGLLPRRHIRPSGESYDISGLGGTEVQRTHRQRKAWEKINTDAMRLRSETIFLQPGDNVVIFEGEKVHAAAYAEHLASGFEHLYRFLQARGPELLTSKGLLRGWSGLRFVFRGTAIYDSVLKRLFSPRCLRDGMDASIELELLTRPLLYAEERPSSWPILAEERKSLLQGDVPVFSYAAEGDDLLLEGGGLIPHFFRQSGFSQVEWRFTHLGDDDLERQLSLLRASFELQQVEPDVADVAKADDSESPEQHNAGADEFLNEALRIAHEIRREARSFKEGVSWNTLAYYDAAQFWQLEPMTPRFYDGLCGVALFLAAAHKLLREPDFGALARSALASIVREALRPEYARILFEPGIGAGIGQTSVIYALVRASDFLQEEEWLHHARGFADMLDAGRITSTRKFDLLMGSAGAALAMLSLYRATEAQDVLDKAVLCGQHLLQHRSASRHGPRAWKTFRQEMLTGFSHGAAGIAYALLKLYEATGESSFREAALEAEAFEASVFLPEISNWPDFRYPPTADGYAHRTAWCHGATGIAMGRLGALSIVDTPEIRQDISHGLQATRMAGLQGWDTVCCGSMGRVELFLLASKALGNSAHRREAETLASSVLRRSRKRGGYSLGWKKAPYLAAFHQGMGGIGYEFLRLAAPFSLPSLLLWE